MIICSLFFSLTRYHTNTFAPRLELLYSPPLLYDVPYFKKIQAMKIIVDYREQRSKVIGSLEKLGADIEITTLKVGDYVVSDSVAFERKRIDNLLATLLERR